jgi:hypothetical protein
MKKLQGLRDKERNLQSDLEIAKREWENKTKDIVHDVKKRILLLLLL